MLVAPLRLNPANTNLRFALIDHLFRNMGHLSLAVLHITLIKKYVKSFQKFYRIFKIKDSIFLDIQRKNLNIYNSGMMSDFNIEAVRSLEHNFYEMQLKIKNFIEKYKEFLDLIITSIKPDLNKAERYHHGLIALENEIDIIFEKVKFNPRALKLYI